MFPGLMECKCVVLDPEGGPASEGGRQHRQINTHGPATPTEPYSIFYWRAHAEELVELCKRGTLVACKIAPSLTATSLHSYLFYSF